MVHKANPCIVPVAFKLNEPVDKTLKLVVEALCIVTSFPVLSKVKVESPPKAELLLNWTCVFAPPGDPLPPAQAPLPLVHKLKPCIVPVALRLKDPVDNTLKLVVEALVISVLLAIVVEVAVTANSCPPVVLNISNKFVAKAGEAS